MRGIISDDSIMGLHITKETPSPIQQLFGASPFLIFWCLSLDKLFSGFPSTQARDFNNDLLNQNKVIHISI